MAISMRDIKIRYCGDRSVLVFGRVLVIVNCTIVVGNSTEIRVLRRSGNSFCGMRKQANPMRVKTIGGMMVCRVKNSLYQDCM